MDIARRLDLHRAGRDWRGSCPACGYGSDAFALTEKQGRVLGWCASCQNDRAIAAALRGVGAAKAPFSVRAPQAAPARSATVETARRLWDRAIPAKGTIADDYLAGRGLAGAAASPVLRFLVSCPHPSGVRLPAMLACITDASGAIVAVHRTFLRRDGGGKASVEPQRASLGSVMGGAIRLGEVDATGAVVIGEGIETSLSAGRLIGLPAWAAVSAGNLARGLVLRPEVRAVVIAAVHDPLDKKGRRPGQNAARSAAARWEAEGRHVRIALPDREGIDFNDVLIERTERDDG